MLEYTMAIETNSVFGLVVNLFETFCSNDGLESLKNIFSVKDISKKAKNLGHTNYRLPFDFLVMLLSPLIATQNFIREDICKDTVNTVETELNTWIELMTDKDIKGMDKSIISSQVLSLRDFFGLSYSNIELTKTTKKYEMAFSIRLLQADSLSKQINGINEINGLVNESEKTESWLDKDYLADWIIKNEVLYQLLIKSPHPELIKRALNIFKLLAKQMVFGDDLLLMLWNLQENNYEELIQEVYSTINGIVEYLSPDKTKFLYDKINETLPKKCNEKMLEFIMNFTLNTFKVYSDDSIIEVSTEIPNPLLNSDNKLIIPDDENLYFVKDLWKLIQDNSVLSNFLIVKALLHLKGLLCNQRCDKYRAQYLYLCLDNIINKVSVPQSLELATNILKILNNKVTTNWIKSLEEKYKMTDLFIKSCEMYASIEKDWIKKKNKKNIENCVLTGKLWHSTNIRIRFHFIETILKLSQGVICMGNENIKKLCDIYIKNALCEWDTETFLKWISWGKYMNPPQCVVFNEKETILLFETICNFRDTLENKFGLIYLDCFANNFKIINTVMGNIKADSKKLTVINFDKLIGLDNIWT